MELKDWITFSIALAALIVSVITLFNTWIYTRRSFRPIVTAMVTTHSSGNVAITYDLVIQNSGNLPAKDVRIEANPESLKRALNVNYSKSQAMEQKWLSCFSNETLILVLLEGHKVTCSFGYTGYDSFWNYGSVIDVIVKYKDWFGKSYSESQPIYIKDTESFTGYQWGSSK